MKRKHHFKYLLPLFIAGILASCKKEIELISEATAPSNVNTKYFLSEESARSIGSRFNFFEGIAQAREISTNIHVIQSVDKINDDRGIPAYYVINYSNNKGFLVLSADYRQMPVLGYSTEGSFDRTDMPKGLEGIVKEEVREISDLRAHNKESIAPSVASNWRYLPAVTNSSIIIDPPTDCIRNEWGELKQAFLKTNWGQFGAYNDLCPWVGGCSTSADQVWQAPTGCVATSMAQLMAYYKWPTTYNWSLMPNNSGSNETAKLMRDAGKAVNMSYGCEASGASSFSVPGALKTTFKYTSAAIMDYTTVGMLDQQTSNAIILQLKANKPVIMSGSDPNEGGHSWIADGFSRGGNCDPYCYIHMNWGWDSRFNGFFDLNNFNPDDLRFSLGKKAIIVGK